MTGRSARRRSPVEVRVVQQLVPTQILTIAARRGVVVNELQVTVTGLNDKLEPSWGDPITHQPYRLRGSASVDVLLTIIPGVVAHRLGVLQEPEPLASYSAADTFVLRVSWSSATDAPNGGAVGLLWTGSDRGSGKAPFVLAESDLEALTGDGSRDDGRLTVRRLRRRGRVKRMSRRYESMQRAQEWQLSDEVAEVIRADSISVRGLRGFRSNAVLRLARPNGEDGSGLTIVVGANNAGKSTIWESFDALARALKMSVSFSDGRRNRFTPDGVRILLERTDGSSVMLASQSGNTSETRMTRLGQTAPRDPEIVPLPSRRYFQASFGRMLNGARDWMTTSGEYTRSRQADPLSQFTGRLFDVHADPVKKSKFDDLMEEVLGYRLDWTIDLADGMQGQSFYLKVATGEGVSHTSEGLGDGIISLLFVVNALYDSEPETLLVVDEPELSLHPQLTRRLGRVISKFAADRQIVVFTHAASLVSWDDIERGAEIARVHKVGDESRISQLGRDAVNRIKKSRGGWKNPHVLGSDATEALFLDDRLIVAEGQEDVGLLPRAFDQLGLPPGGALFGWGAGGAERVEHILTILQQLGFARVAAILDNDKPAEAEKLELAFPDYFITMIPAADIRDKPDHANGGKIGLFDKDGHSLKPEVLEATRAVLTSVNDYLSDDAPSDDDSAQEKDL